MDEVTEKLATIRQHMPETYRAIKAREKGVIEDHDGQRVVVVPAYGTDIYALVRRGLRGEPNCFWAMERGHVMGTPFSLTDIGRDAAWSMVAWGSAHVCIFQEPKREAAHGAH